MAGGGGYWIITSDIRAGQTANANGLADVHLLHVASTSAPTPDKDITLVSDTENDRAPHLAAYGSGPDAGGLGRVDGDRRLRAERQEPPDVPPGPRQHDRRGAGGIVGDRRPGPLMLSPNVLGSRYQDFRAYPDGCVAYPAPGSSGDQDQDPARPRLQQLTRSVLVTDRRA